jgi:hypothetical protein
MKFIVGAVIVLSSAAALATPAVGDYVKYDVQVTQGAQVVTGTLERELTGFDAGAQAYAEKQTTTVNGQVQTQESTVAASDLINDAGIANILNNCAAYGGSAGSVTVPAGTFNVCAVPVNNNSQRATYAVTTVPYGFVAADVVTVSNGAHTVATLDAYKAGQKK